MDLQAQARAHRLGQQHEVRGCGAGRPIPVMVCVPQRPPACQRHSLASSTPRPAARPPGPRPQVKVLRLVTAGSIEERVVDVASGKAQLADRSITGGWLPGGAGQPGLPPVGLDGGLRGCPGPDRIPSLTPAPRVPAHTPHTSQQPTNPAGGFFDGKTSAAERQRYLLEAIRSSAAAAAAAAAADDGAAGGGAGDALSDAALNALLARRPGEAELLEAEDARVRVRRLGSVLVGWGGQVVEEAGARPRPALGATAACELSSAYLPTLLCLLQSGELAAWQAAAGAAAAADPAAFSRLASAEEVAPLVRQAQELLAPKKDEDEGERAAWHCLLPFCACCAVCAVHA